MTKAEGQANFWDCLDQFITQIKKPAMAVFLQEVIKQYWLHVGIRRVCMIGHIFNPF